MLDFEITSSTLVVPEIMGCVYVRVCMCVYVYLYLEVCQLSHLLVASEFLLKSPSIVSVGEFVVSLS